MTSTSLSYKQVLYSDTDAVEPSNVQILALQGHPEFYDELMLHLISTFENDGEVSADAAEQAKARAVLIHDGDGVIGRAVWRVLGAVDSKDNSSAAMEKSVYQCPLTPSTVCTR